MKILIKVLFMLLFMVTPLYSQGEIALTNINAYYYDPFSKTVLNTTLQINSSINEGETYAIIYFEPTLVQYAAFFIKEQRIELLAALQKYKEWHEIAIKNKVEHAKDIAVFPVYAVVDRNFLKTTVYYPNLTIHFVSNSIAEHYLYFIFHEAPTDNIFLKMNPGSFFLDYENVILLEQMLQEDNILEGLENLRKNDALFQ